MAFKADLLRKKLRERGRTRAELAIAIGKHKRTVSRWLAGKNPPKPKDLEAIARFLNCRPQDFDPFFADMGAGEVSIQAHVSTASHNAYELMRWRYGVSQKQIIELAPVLFAIVAGHALKVPEQDEEIARQAVENGLADPLQPGCHLERRASRSRKCFGLQTSRPELEVPRNLFSEAIRRLSAHVSEYADAGWFVGAEPEDVPGAAGYIVDTELVRQISGGDETLAEAIAGGRIRLSEIVRKVKEEQGNASIEAIVEAVRRSYSESRERQRAAGLRKLRAWRKFYAERYPDLAEEYDRIVARHCHEEGWYPDYYTDDDRFQSDVDPYREDRHINEETLVEYQRLREEERSEESDFDLVDPMQDPVYRRFEELKRHRSEIKKEFEETWAR